MFLMDFFLPGEWTLFWYVVSIIIVIYGIKKVNFERKNNSEFKTMFIYAFIFMLLSMIISVPNELIVGFTGIGSYAAISGIGCY